jgi:hypothetical protein
MGSKTADETGAKGTLAPDIDSYNVFAYRTFPDLVRTLTNEGWMLFPLGVPMPNRAQTARNTIPALRRLAPLELRLVLLGLQAFIGARTRLSISLCKERPRWSAASDKVPA